METHDSHGSWYMEQLKEVAVEEVKDEAPEGGLDRHVDEPKEGQFPPESDHYVMKGNMFLGTCRQGWKILAVSAHTAWCPGQRVMAKVEGFGETHQDIVFDERVPVQALHSKEECFPEQS